MTSERAGSWTEHPTCGICMDRLEGNQDMATPHCGCFSCCESCLLKKVFDVMPSRVRCDTCRQDVEKYQQRRYEVVQGARQLRRRGERTVDLGTMKQHQSKMAHPSATEYLTADDDTKADGIHLQMLSHDGTGTHAAIAAATLVGGAGRFYFRRERESQRDRSDITIY